MLQNSKKKTYNGVFVCKVASSDVQRSFFCNYQYRTPLYIFMYKLCYIFQNSYSIERLIMFILRTSGSERLLKLILIKILYNIFERMYGKP